MKGVKRWLLMHDWIWSVAVAFLSYWFLNMGPSSVGGVAMEYYAINWIQALIATAGIMAGLFAAARIGLWFNLRKVHNYLWGKRYKVEESGIEYREYKLYSFEDFIKLKAWQKLLFASFWLVFFFSVAVIVFLRLLAAASVTPL